MLYCIGNKKILYRFTEPRHKVMVLTGFSGTGKSQFYNLVSKMFTEKKDIEYYCSNSSGYKTTPELDIKTIELVMTNYALGMEVNNTIIVVDETTQFVKASNVNQIAKFVNDERNSTNYFIFIMRELSILSGLSIHVEELYKISIYIYIYRE